MERFYSPVTDTARTPPAWHGGSPHQRLRLALPADLLPRWRQSHPLEAVWNRLFAPYLERRARFRHFMQQRYMDHGKRGKGNKANRRAKALYADPGLLFWPEYFLR